MQLAPVDRCLNAADLAELCRDHGGRTDRQKARLMWMVEERGVDWFRDTIAEYMGEPLSKGVRSTNQHIVALTFSVCAI